MTLDCWTLDVGLPGFSRFDKEQILVSCKPNLAVQRPTSPTPKTFTFKMLAP